MRVIIYAQDLSGRRDDGFYTKPNIESALDIFFTLDTSQLYSDSEAENSFSRADAEALFALDKTVTFYSDSGEKVVITLDPSK